MKEKLLKYGISTALLSKQQLDSFEVYANDIKNNNLMPFYRFEADFSESKRLQTQMLDSLRQETASLIKRAINFTEDTLPNSSQTLLASFGSQYSSVASEKNHIDLLLKLSALADEANAAIGRCNSALASQNNNQITELTLRYVALSESAEGTELHKLYESLYQRREQTSFSSYAKTAEEYLKLAMLFEDQTKKLCFDADAAYQAAKDNNPSITSYYKTLRQYVSILHQMNYKEAKMSKYKYIFFDLDGTLTDSAPGITNSVVYALDKFGIKETDINKLKRFVGPPLVDAFMEFYGFSEEDAKKAVEYYRERFKDIGIFENSVYDGVKELLSDLKSEGYTLVIATSKPEVFANRIAEHFDFAKYFDSIRGATFDGKLNTKTQIIEYAIASLNINNREEIVMIGDRYHDAEGAKATGVDFIGVLYGYGSREELVKAGATLIAKTPANIKNYL